METALVKYIYLDVVGFTDKRSVEAQTEIIAILNDIVKKAVSDRIPKEQVVFIPVGDGICISIIGSTQNYDDHIRIAEDIIRTIVSVYNPTAKHNRQFEVRIGLNENIDNIITDINGNKNVCGAGVNYAQRIMSFADSSQILVGRATYDSLQPREKYSMSFRSYKAQAKHNTIIDIYQYIGGNVAALNKKPPSAFAPPPEKQLTNYVAYYIAHVMKNRNFIDRNLDRSWQVFALAVLMAYLAEDSVGLSTSSKIHTYDKHIPETPHNTIDEQFDLFNKLPSWVCLDLLELKVEMKILRNYSYCFEPDSYGLFATERGTKKLQSEWLKVWQEFGFS